MRIDPDDLRAVVQRAEAADLQAILLVANNNGTASEAAWDRITAHPSYQRLQANLAQSRRLLEAL